MKRKFFRFSCRFSLLESPSVFLCVSSSSRKIIMKKNAAMLRVPRRGVGCARFARGSSLARSRHDQGPSRRRNERAVFSSKASQRGRSRANIVAQGCEHSTNDKRAGERACFHSLRNNYFYIHQFLIQKHCIVLVILSDRSLFLRIAHMNCTFSTVVFTYDYAIDGKN